MQEVIMEEGVFNYRLRDVECGLERESKLKMDTQ